MKIDQLIFENVLGREYNPQDEKDVMAAISLHFWLNNLGIWSETRDYGYVLTDDGLVSLQCRQDVLNQCDDLRGLEFSQTTMYALAALEIALENTTEILRKPFDERDAVISSAVYKYIKNEYHLGREEDDEKIKLEFEKHFTAGDYELGKTCCQQAEIVHNSFVDTKGLI